MRPDHVWSTAITYAHMSCGIIYLTAAINWYRRYVLSWRPSNTLEGSFCLDALEEALQQGKPDIFNTDQGAQYTATSFSSRLSAAGIAISMDGRAPSFG